MYGYDADGRRVRSYGGASGNMRTIYSGLNVLFEAPDGGGAATLRFYAGGQQVAKKTGSWVTYLHQDHLGSTRLETDASSVIPFRGNYQPYGVASGLSGSEEFRYTGKPSDSSTGLYYFGARYYDPSIGRFITEDPHPGSLSDPQSLNRYAYCRDNPHKYVDPDGKIAQLVAAIIGGATVGALYKLVSYTVAETTAGRSITGEGALSAVTTGAITGATMTLALTCPGLGAAILGAATGTLNYEIDCTLKGEKITTEGMILNGVVGGVTTYATQSIMPDAGYKINKDAFAYPEKVVTGIVAGETVESLLDYGLKGLGGLPTPEPTVPRAPTHPRWMYPQSDYDQTEQRRGA